MIKLTEKIGYGFGDMASSMFWKLFGAYLMIFYTDVFGLPAAVVGTMFLITRIWDSAFDPIVGVVADRTHSRWGKFRPYLLWLAVPFGIIGVLTFVTPDWSPTGKLVYAYVTYSLMMMIYSAINVPYASLLGVMSPNPKERNTLSTYRMTFAYIGSFIALLLFMPLVNFFSGNSKDLGDQQTGWTMAVVVIAILCIILFFGCFAWTKERVKPIKEAQNPLKEDLKDLFKNKPWWILLGAGVAALVFNSIRDGATVYYFKYFVVEEDYATVSFFGMSFVLSGLYLALGQAAPAISRSSTKPSPDLFAFAGASVVNRGASRNRVARAVSAPPPVKYRLFQRIRGLTNPASGARFRHRGNLPSGAACNRTFFPQSPATQVARRHCQAL